MIRYSFFGVALCVALTACGVDEPELDDVQQEVSLYCPGVEFNGVTGYQGITGTYRRTTGAVVGEPTKLTLFALTDYPQTRGTFTGFYTGANGLPTPYAGLFGTIPDNPAIGAAFFLDTNSDSEWDKLYFVLGISRSFGLVKSLCLIGGDQPFMITRSVY